MKITIVQTDIEWNKPDENLAHVEGLIASAPGSDVYVLPEMFNTGFVTQPSVLQTGTSEQAEAWMKKMAKASKACIVGSVATPVDGGYVNRCHLVTPGGKDAWYDKHHLFTYGGEDKTFKAGGERVETMCGDIRIRLLVCYDLRFPLWSRQRRGAPYDVLVCVASWPESRIGAWRSLLRARAIENQCYVVGVNRVGTDPLCKYCGGSMIIDPYGVELVACPDNTECLLTATIDMERLRAFRRKFPVLEDADNYSIEADA